jgi:hypothetical protein
MCLLSHRKGKALAVKLLESGRLDRDLIRSNGKKVGTLRTAVVGHDSTSKTRVRLGYCDICLGNSGAGGIGYCAKQRSSAELRPAADTENCG